MAHKMPWPSGMAGSPEVLAIGNALMDMPRTKLAAVGRTAVHVNDYQSLQAQRRRDRARKAAEREEFRRKGRYAGPADGRRDPAMTGRPARRARLAAAAQGASGEPPRQPVELPPKPAEDAPEAEKRAYAEQVRAILRAELRELRRPQREADLGAGRARPKNRAEMEIFAKDLLGERKRPDG